MPAYLQSADYAAYGIAGATAAQVATAGALIDAQVGRPEGLMWLPDAAGNPGWMAGKTPVRSYAMATATTPGMGTQITVTGAAFGYGDAGQAVVLDRNNSNRAETCVIASAIGGTLTLESTAFPHNIGTTIEYGLAVAEEARIGRDGQIRTNARPVARVLSIYGNRRFSGYSLRDASDEELLATNYSQSAPWGGFPPSQCDLDGVTGSCWMLPGAISPYGEGSRVRISYIAGWDYANLPDAIKRATATLVGASIALGEAGFSGNIKLLKAGDGTIERFSGAGGGSSLFDASTLNLLAPYRNIRI